MAANQYGLVDLDLTGELGPKAGAAALPFKFSSPSLTVDLAAQTLRAGNFAAQYAAAKMSGSVNGEQIVDKPAMSGRLALEPVALRDLMTQLGMALPQTRDAKAFSRLSLKTDFRYADKSVRLQNLDAQLDDSRLQGAVSMTDLDTKAARSISRWIILTSIAIAHRPPPRPHRRPAGSRRNCPPMSSNPSMSKAGLSSQAQDSVAST
ncbi:MAG: hypothetical protein WDM77_19255 [Steroidobacteraceae bacterium]